MPKTLTPTVRPEFQLRSAEPAGHHPRPAETNPPGRQAASATDGAVPVRLWPLGDGIGGVFDASLAALAARLHCGRDNGD